MPKGRSKPFVAALLVGAALSGLGGAAKGAIAPAAVEDLSRYCTACWRNARLQPDHWPDCTQEVLVRLLERVRPESWDKLLSEETQERRELLRAIDAVKKRTQRARRLSGLAEDVAARQTDGAHEDRQIVSRLAEEHLSPRQQRIIELCMDGWSVGDIAGKLQTPTAQVSDEKYKAIQKLRRHANNV